MQPINVLSLFDGMSCGQLALDQLGIPVANYYASEIDKFAIKVAKANYPNMVHLGDVREVETHENLLRVKHDKYGMPKNWENHVKIDLLIGGSPCQGFSFAGKNLNFDDPRSKLFFEYVRLLKALKPKYFLLENVKMKKESEQIISDMLGVEPVQINSNLVSAQNRKRLYWTNIPFAGMPEDRGVKLSDVLEYGFVDRDKSHCIDANYWKGGNLKTYFDKSRRQLVFSDDGLCHVGDADISDKHEWINRVYHPEGKAPTLTASTGGHTQPKVLVKGARIVNRRLDAEGKRKDNDKSIPLQAQLELRDDDKTNCLSTVSKDSVLANAKILQTGRGYNKGGLKAQDGKAPTLSTSSWQHNNHLTFDEGITWRKLTPVECERLQTVPDNYTAHVSNTQRYKMLGNGWTIEVIKHLLAPMKGE